MSLLESVKIPLIHRRVDSDIVNLRVIVDAGSMQETPEQYGTAHFLEHMFFKGTERRPYKEVNALSSKLGDINAYTTFDRTVYHMSCLADDFETAASLLLEMVFEPGFPEEELQREIGVVLEELQTYEDNPQHHFSFRSHEAYLGEAAHNVVGTRESVKSMTVNRLQDFRADWYGSNRMRFGVFGNVSQERASVASGRYADWASPADHCFEWNPEDFHFHHASKQAIFELVYRGCSLQEEVDFDFLPDVLASAIGGGMHSLLFDRIREELGLCYAVFANHSSWKHDGVFTTYCMLDPKNIEQAAFEIRKVLAGVCMDGVSDDLLDTAKKNYLFRVGRRLESSSGTGLLADCCFDIDDVQAYLDFDTRKQRVLGLTNDHVIEFARSVFGDGIEPKLVTMTPDA